MADFKNLCYTKTGKSVCIDPVDSYVRLDYNRFKEGKGSMSSENIGLDKIGMTADEFAAWLEAHGCKRKKAVRRKRPSGSMYD